MKLEEQLKDLEPGEVELGRVEMRNGLGGLSLARVIIEGCDVYFEVVGCDPTFMAMSRDNASKIGRLLEGLNP